MTLIIAEAGVNHNGNEKNAFDLIDVAKRSGADIVKFQTFDAKSIATADAKKAEYQSKNTKINDSQLAMLRGLELSHDAFRRLAEYSNRLGIEFLSTAFDYGSLMFLVEEIGLQRLKIPSGEITNAPLILEHARTQMPLIVSTGMASLAEIEAALGIIAYGYISSKKGKPSTRAFEDAYSSDEGQKALKNNITLLHCTTEYPAPINEINLRAMLTLSKTFGLNFGYSDHTDGIIASISAVSLGAKIIEKHFTLNKDMEGPDHKASLAPNELNQMVDAIRKTELALGRKIKFPTKSEIKNKLVARKSLVAEKDIKKGEKFSTKNLAVKRPGMGINPNYFWEFLGKEANKNYKKGDLIES